MSSYYYTYSYDYMCVGVLLCIPQVMLVPDLKALLSQRPNAGHLKSFKFSAGKAGEREPGGAHRALGSGVGVGLAPRHWGPETSDAGTGSGAGIVEVLPL